MSDADRSGLGSERPSASSTNPLNRLTQREREVLALVADGNANKAIGRKLGISELTVKDHLKVIFLKLDVDSRTSAAGVWFRFVGTTGEDDQGGILMRYSMAVAVTATFVAAIFGSGRAAAQAPSAVPSVRATQASYVVGLDSALDVHVKDMPAECGGQIVEVSFFIRNGAEPSKISTFPDSPTAGATVATTGAAEAQVPLPHSVAEPVRVWPGLTGGCLKQPVVDESLGVELAVFDPSSNPDNTSTILVSSAGLASVPNRPDGMTIGAVVRTISAFADGKPCATVPVDPKVTGGAPVKIRLGVSGQPAECSRAGAAITFANAEGKEFVTKMTLVAGATRLLDNFAAGTPPTTSGSDAQPAPPSVGVGVASQGGSTRSWRQFAGVTLLGLAALVGIAAVANVRRRAAR